MCKWLSFIRQTTTSVVSLMWWQYKFVSARINPPISALLCGKRFSLFAAFTAKDLFFKWGWNYLYYLLFKKKCYLQFWCKKNLFKHYLMFHGFECCLMNRCFQKTPAASHFECDAMTVRSSRFLHCLYFHYNFLFSFIWSWIVWIWSFCDIDLLLFRWVNI